jgi:hypothetical protein
MHGVVLQHISQVVWFKQIVNRDDFDVFEILYCRAKHHASNTAKPIDTDFDCHIFNSLDKKIEP